MYFKTLMYFKLFKPTVLCSIASLAMAAGCGGGDSNNQATPTPSRDTLAPRILRLTLTATPPGSVDLSVNGKGVSDKITVINADSEITVVARIRDDSGIDTANPPTVSIYDNDGSNSTVADIQMTPAKVTDQWEAKFKLNVSPPQSFDGVKLVSITATDKKGNQAAIPAGVLYYSSAQL